MGALQFMFAAKYLLAFEIGFLVRKQPKAKYLLAFEIGFLTGNNQEKSTTFPDKNTFKVMVSSSMAFIILTVAIHPSATFLYQPFSVSLFAFIKLQPFL